VVQSRLEGLDGPVNEGCLRRGLQLGAGVAICWGRCGAGVVFDGAGVKFGRVIGVPAIGPLTVGGGVRASCLLGVKVAMEGLFSFPMGFFALLFLVWALRAMFCLHEFGGC
jgi:hypothetical protein